MDKESYNEGFRDAIDTTIKILEKLRDAQTEKKVDVILTELLGKSF